VTWTGVHVGLFEKIIERLGDQPTGLPNAFDDIDQREKHHEPADLAALVMTSGGTGRRDRPLGAFI
jgi:long-subunit acyl-CoA synthetase (AMP-forming)